MFNKKRFGWGLLVSVVCVISLAWLLAQWLGTPNAGQEVLAFKAVLDRAEPWLLLWRLAVLGLFIGHYPFWVTLWARLHRLNAGERDFLISRRWQVAGLLVAFELLFVQKGLVFLVRAF